MHTIQCNCQPTWVWQRHRTVVSHSLFLSHATLYRTHLLSFMKFCINMYASTVDNRYKLIEYQGHRSEVRVT